MKSLRFMVFVLALVAAGCGRRETPAEAGRRTQTLHLVRGSEPQELDPHVITGSTEHDIILALLEGLVSEDPVDLHPVPGVAESWDTSPNLTVYTFHLRHNARWSNGDPVTARDFLDSYRRALAPKMAYQYSYMLYVVTNAEAFNNGTLTNFDAVGFKAVDDYTFRVTLNSPTPYFLSLLCHQSWFPVHLPTIAKYGNPFERGSQWTRAGRYVGNGPFVLADWKVNYKITVKKNTNYWDAANCKLNALVFHAVENQNTEERMFRAGQLNVGYQLIAAKIDSYRRGHPELLHIEPFLTVYFYRINVTKPPLNDKRVRQALSIAMDRESIVKNVTRGGQLPAYALTPPNTDGYTCRAQVPKDLGLAKRLLAEAGYPEGNGFPPIEILYNTMEDHKRIAEAIQEMWKKNLGIEVRLLNQEWKVYLDSCDKLNYQISRAGWTGDYPDPNSFLDMFLTGGGNNYTGWSNAEYDRLIHEAARTRDPAKRLEVFQQAEAILLDEAPIIPIYVYTRVYLKQPYVKGYYPTILDDHPYKYIWLETNDADTLTSLKAKPNLLDQRFNDSTF